MGRELFEEIRKLIGEVLSSPSRVLCEQVLPVAARQLEELTDRVVRSWNRAYAEFAEARSLAYDIAATFNLPTRVSRGAKEVRNITQDSEESLVSTINWVSDRFRKDYQNEVVKRGGDLREAVRRLKEAADRAESLTDSDLRNAASMFIKDFLPFRTAISEHVYRSVGAIVRRAEEIINRFLPSEQRPSHPPSGKRGPQYKGTPLESPEAVSEAVSQIIERLDTFTHLSEPTIGEIEKVADLSTEIAKDFVITPAPEKEKEKEKEPASTVEAGGRKKRITDWLRMAWEDDFEIGAFI